MIASLSGGPPAFSRPLCSLDNPGDSCAWDDAIIFIP
jgi:hypothetical protein